MTLACVPIMVEDEADALEEAQRARDAGADLVEYRVDRFFSGSPDEERAVVRLVSRSPLPCIVTCRTAGDEGGEYDGDEQSRIALFERLGAAPGRDEHPPRYIDIEHSAYSRSANLRQKVNLAVKHPGQVRDVGASLILSTHDFNSRPPDLIRRLADMQSHDAAAVLKVAYRARSIRDNLELFDLPSETDRPTIALGMGAFGLMSRVLAPKFGGFLTFASLRAGSETAPGQPLLDDLLSLYRFRSIKRTTHVYGIVGWPIEHSLSPRLHNAGFEAINHDGVYVPLPVPDGPEHFNATMTALIEHPRLDFAGCSVTIPHKENLVRLAQRRIREGDTRWSIDQLSELSGAANTLVIDRDGPGITALRIVNTDGPAAASCLEDQLGDLADKRIGVIGAGGAARAIAAALALAGATVVIYNRTAERAEALADSLKGKTPGKTVAADIALLEKTRCHALVNCTPVGMQGGPNPDGTPIPLDALASCAQDAVVFDTVYAPPRTPLLRAAEQRAMRTISGVRMFLRQAESQFALWTGTKPPPHLFTHDAAPNDHPPQS